MITLDSTLATAQDSMDRHPLVELISSQFQPDKPFAGNYFNTETTSEEHPALISVSDGRLAAVYIRDDDTIYYQYTDTDRTEWTKVEIYAEDPATTVHHVSLCELTDGNIGIVFFDTSGSNRRLRYMVVSKQGAIITAAANIATFATASYWVDSVYVTRLNNDSYMMVYAHKNLSTGDYSIMKRTATSFTSWSSESAITLTGQETDQQKDNPSLLDTAADGLMLLFDYVNEIRDDGSELINVYYCTSGDNGASWTAPAALTSYSVFGSVGKHPVATERSDESIEIAYYEETNVLHADITTTGWQSDCSDSFVTGLHYDSTTDKLYALSTRTKIGSKNACGVVVIDVATWTIDRCYTTTTVPAYEDYFGLEGVSWLCHQGDGYFVGFGSGKQATLINHDNETITHYAFEDNATYGLIKNVDLEFSGDYMGTIAQTWVDANTNRFYILLKDNGYYDRSINLGYIDITETANPITGMYTWHDVVKEDHFYRIDATGSDLHIVPEMDYVIIGFGSSSGSYKGYLSVFKLSTGALLKHYSMDDYPGFHYRGAQQPVYYDGHIYAHFAYEPLYGQEERKGLMDINLTNDAIVYHRPSWGTHDDYCFETMKVTGDGRIVIGTNAYGITVFNIADQTWELFDNTSVPGLTPDANNSIGLVEYDPVSGTIFAGDFSSSGWVGVLAFNEYGAFKQGKYIGGEYTTSWSFDSPASLTVGLLDYEQAVAIDGDDVMWSIWTRQDTLELSNKWAKESPALELTDYLIAGQDVKASWQLDAPAKLSFSCSHGHLFDPQNLMSTLSTVLRKGRKITLRFGELISGVNYWQNQGTFIVRETSLSYQRGRYPTISVNCEDMRRLFKDCKVVATEYYDDAYPEPVIEDLLTTHGNMLLADIDMPTFDNRHTIYHQFIDEHLGDMITEILDHFGYFACMDVDGKFTARRVQVDGSVDHVYPDTEKIISFSPDDSYSTFTNRVVAKGEGRYFLEVLLNEESVGSLSGTVGWWGKKEEEIVWYSEDHARTCRDPRLEVLQSVRDFSLFLVKGGGREYISDVDSEEHYCEITIESPNFTGLVTVNLAALATIGYLALGCDTHFACGAYIFSITLLTSTLLAILSAVASYNYNIWAKPIGHEKQTFQAEANDYDFQREINGLVVTEDLDDPFCYTVQSCHTVANQEMDVVRAQRNRITFNKIAHLQDEVGDTIQIPHPYSGIELKTFITNLTRSYKKPAPGKSADGGISDDIQGWKLG